MYREHEVMEQTGDIVAVLTPERYATERSSALEEYAMREAGSGCAGYGECGEVAGITPTQREYCDAMEDIIGSYGEHFPNARRERLESLASCDGVHAYSDMEYRLEFPQIPASVLAHHDPATDTIHIRDSGDLPVFRHAMTHEAMHRASFSGTRVLDDGESGTKIVRCSGLRETGECVNRNIGLNEGVTEMYTLQSLERRDESDAAKAISAYGELQRRAAQLTDIVGEETMSRAYFGGEMDVLRNKVERLNGSERAFERLCANMDTMVETAYYDVYKAADYEVARMLLIMRRNRG